jgi:hypothetical protein
MLFVAGIPVWLIRPISSFTNQNILTVAEMCPPQLCMDLFPRPTILFKGHTGAAAKFKAIEEASHQFSLHPDPFEIPAFDEAVNSSVLIPKAPPSRAQATRVPRRGPASRRTNPYPKPGKGPNGGISRMYLSIPSTPTSTE